MPNPARPTRQQYAPPTPLHPSRLLARAADRGLEPRHPAFTTLAHPASFSLYALQTPLRAYQQAIANAILRSILDHSGLTFAVLMARQAGKNETSAHLEALLLTLFRSYGGWLVKASPTFQPQTVNSILRLEARLENAWTGQRWHRERGYMVCLGRARAAFFSAQPGASVVGATASILLEADEAQEISEEKWNKDFRPMGAATNVTTVLWGTAWTPDTLLARSVAALRRQEGQDGRRRVFVVPWTDVAAEVPAYRAYVQAEIERLGPTHPIVRTQYALEDVDSVSPMFPPSRQALMRGDHLAHVAPDSDTVYALTVDVAGQAVEGESRPGDDNTRDCTACTLFAVCVAGSGDPLAGRPRYSVARRWWWRGVGQAELYQRLTGLAETWSPAASWSTPRASAPGWPRSWHSAGAPASCPSPSPPPPKASSVGPSWASATPGASAITPSTARHPSPSSGSRSPQRSTSCFRVRAVVSVGAPALAVATTTIFSSRPPSVPSSTPSPGAPPMNPSSSRRPTSSTIPTGPSPTPGTPPTTSSTATTMRT